MADEIEYETRTLLLDEKMPATVAEWEKEGWQVLTGAPPVVVFHIGRVKGAVPPPTSGGMGRLTVDDNKVMILRADGTLEKF